MRRPSSHPGFDAMVNHGKQHPGHAKATVKAADPIQIDPQHKGKLHERLGIAEGKPIPEARLKQAEHSGDASLRLEAQFADNAKRFKH